MSGNVILKNNSVFDLNNHQAYEDWRDEKLDNYPHKAEQLIVEINNPQKLTKTEYQALAERIKKTNMVVYVSPTGTTLDKNMGADDDGITSLQVSHSEGRERYIPYTNKAIHWHTDGYYNHLGKQVNALCLHCVQPATRGGENALLDHEIAYIRLRDLNPDYVHVLMQPDAMTIPANIKDGRIIRPERRGPVFSVSANNTLHMRYTERAHNIIWRCNPATQAAVKALEDLLHSNDPAIYRCTLQPGWGLMSNNVLHDRSGFEDNTGSSRLLYRLRYYERLGLNNHSA